MNCNFIGNNSALTTSPYCVKSSVLLDVIWQFVEATESKAVEVTNQNVSNLV
jgi:hypothetical protein